MTRAAASEAPEAIWDTLREPPASFRPIPFWSWNGRLEKEELERQIEEMSRAGLGGFFMHARGGLKTPFMEEEWMDAVRASIEKAKSLGLEPWLYDEYGWPSGFGGGKIPALGVSYQQKKLAVELAPFSLQPNETVGNTIAYYTKTEQGYRRVTDDGQAAAAAELRIYWKLNPYYIDTLSRRAVRAFIEGVYEAYWAEFGEEFGNVLKGVFTDEPQFGRGELPWSFELEEEYRRQYGRELADDLPGLFVEEPDCRASRYRYWSCVTRMFTDAFAKQIGDWCGERGWSLTGHVVDEQTLMGQATSVGDPMAFYEHLQIPGCDWLGRLVDEEPLVPKQVSSVARQLGKKRTITESYGCAGWNISLQDMKRIGEWQYVHGINMMCQHLQSYSLQGMRKRDYPPSLFFQQPWWPDYNRYNEYFARLSLLLSEGERQAQALLLHPVRTAWVEQCGQDSSAVRSYHEAFALLSRWLCRSCVEHDYGSESIIERHGKAEGGRLIVGEAAYKAVIVPPSVTWSHSTVELLLAFQEQGGIVTMFAPYPTLIDGRRDVRLERLLDRAVKPAWHAESAVEAVSHAAPPFVRLAREDGMPADSDLINVQTMRLGDAWLYYIVHSGDSGYGIVTVELAREGKVMLLNLETGEEEHIGQHTVGGYTRLRLPLPAAQSYMLKQESMTASLDSLDNAHLPAEKSLPETAEPGTEQKLMPTPVERRLALDAPWQVKEMDLNALTLDYCRFSVDGGEWSETLPVIFIQKRLLELGRPARVSCEFRFEVGFDVAADRELYLVMEQPERADIEINGSPLAAADCGWWRDPSFRKLDLRGRLVTGENRLVVTTLFNQPPELYAALERAAAFESEGNKLTFETELENVYLLGSFGVSSHSPYSEGEGGSVHTTGPFVLTEPPASLYSGDFVRQGLPFFAGTLRLEQSFLLPEAPLPIGMRVKWRFQAPPDAAVTRLIVNGHEIRTFLWEPFEADITPWLTPGANRFELELTGSCRNLLGPHHHVKGEPIKIGPDSFTDKAGWTDKDLSPGANVYVDRYSFVRFGLGAAPELEWK